MPESDRGDLPQETSGSQEERIVGTSLQHGMETVPQNVRFTIMFGTMQSQGDISRCACSTAPSGDDGHQVSVVIVRVVICKDCYLSL